MRARRRLDIGWLDLAYAIARCFRAGDSGAARRAIEARASPGSKAIACLSVRTALDLFLAARALPRGSEVLCTAYNIPDMTAILDYHGLVPVPIDFALEDGYPAPEDFERACTPRTRALLVAHLFGARVPMDAIHRWARPRGLEVWEDCAQAFEGRSAWGHPDSDLALFSFGPIKTATALGGAVAIVRSADALAAMRAAEERYPVQLRGAYLGRCLKYALLKGLSHPLPYTLFVGGARLFGVDYDRALQSTLRSFAGEDLFTALRRRPSGPLLALLRRRLDQECGAAVRGRTALGREVTACLPAAMAVAGAHQRRHSFWVYPLLVDEPATVVAALRAAGFDATTRATLRAIPPPLGSSHPPATRLARDAERVVYLPWDNALPSRVRARLVQALRAAARLGYGGEPTSRSVLVPAVRLARSMVSGAKPPASTT